MWRTYSFTMAPVTVITVRLGMVNAYIVRQEGLVLIDTGIPENSDAILSALAKADTGRGELTLIALTHGHGDHAGSAARLREKTGAKIAIHEKDAHMLRTGEQGPLVPTGLTGRIIKPFIGGMNRESYPAADPDIVFTGTFDLAPYGVSGTIVPTPGHTAGSVSVVLAGGELFCGDLISPQIPSGKPGLPFWAEDGEEIYASVKMLLAYNPKTFYLGHGGPFPADAVRQMFT
jgi:hydroxyacylglutathione hydrolase